jgi:hypothetical protein
MKVAKARYTGPMRSSHRRVPSGESYTFHRYESQPEREWEIIEDIDDARHLADTPTIEVEWTPLGRLKAASETPLEAISEMGYQAKQKLVGDEGFDLDVAGNSSEEDLEEALREHVKRLDESGDL